MSGDAPVVRARGELDIDTAPGLHREITDALAEHRDVVVDLSEVTFMDCAGLAALVQTRNQAESMGARLVLRGVGAPVARVLRLTGLGRRLAPTE